MPQVPSVAPAALVHVPPQHSRSVEQTSPFWRQNDALPLQMPALQKPPQQSLSLLHGLPDVWQGGVHGAGAQLSGAQIPPPVPFGEHCPLQQSLPTAHAPLSATHALFEHVLFTHEPR
jgi:hypothetical protein